MAAETRDMIAGAVKTLLLEKKVKKLTVKEIVNECGITRQTFYYYFADIPDLLKWILERSTDRFVEESLRQGNAEQGLRYLFLLSLSARPYIRRGLKTNYGDVFERLCEEHFFAFFMHVARRCSLYAQYSQADLRLILQYHSQAVLGILKKWDESDNDSLDHVVHLVYQLVLGKVSPR